MQVNWLTWPSTLPYPKPGTSTHLLVAQFLIRTLVESTGPSDVAGDAADDVGDGDLVGEGDPLPLRGPVRRAELSEPPVAKASIPQAMRPVITIIAITSGIMRRGLELGALCDGAGPAGGNRDGSGDEAGSGVVAGWPCGLDVLAPGWSWKAAPSPRDSGSRAG